MIFSLARVDRCRRNMWRLLTRLARLWGQPQGRPGRVHLKLQETPPSPARADVQTNSRDVAQPGRAHPWGG
jgi:hypothetical protein